MRTTGFLLGLGMLIPAVSMAEEVRQHGSHVHGESVLNIAIEGKVIDMELHAPGADTVGFEYPASSPEDREAVQRAVGLLQQGGKVLALSPEAGCDLERSDVHLSQEPDAHEDDDHGHDDHDEDHDEDEQADHNEFLVTYRFGCADPDALERIDLNFFDLFPYSQKLKIQLITGSGAHAFDATRDRSRFNLPDSR